LQRLAVFTAAVFVLLSSLVVFTPCSFAVSPVFTAAMIMLLCSFSSLHSSRLYAPQQFQQSSQQSCLLSSAALVVITVAMLILLSSSSSLHSSHAGYILINSKNYKEEKSQTSQRINKTNLHFALYNISYSSQSVISRN